MKYVTLHRYDGFPVCAGKSITRIFQYSSPDEDFASDAVILLNENHGADVAILWEGSIPMQTYRKTLPSLGSMSVKKTA